MKRFSLLLGLLGLCLVAGCADKTLRRAADQHTEPGLYAQSLSQPITLELDYWLYLPKNYYDQQKWPLLVFLHGAGERGQDLNRLKIHGPIMLVEQGKDLPFIIVAPQCPADQWWPYRVEHISAVIDEIVEKYPVDTKRIYMTGLSMGGYGTWATATRYPDRFAAIAPICGGGEVLLANLLKAVPIWAFHGDKDTIVPLSESQRMVDAVNNAGGNAKLTIYPGVNHNSWTQTYNNDALYEWFLSHSR